MSESSSRRGGPLSLLMVFVGAAGFAGGLTALYVGMRDLMYSGGSCGQGGPYVIENECTNGQVTLIMGGVFVMLIFGGILMGASGRFGGTSFLGTGLLMWAALFGALGYNFISLGFNPPDNVGGAIGWIISGIVFWLMALGGLIPGLSEVKSFLARGSQPEPSMFKPPLVRANVPVQPMPGFPGGMPGAQATAESPTTTQPTTTQSSTPQPSTGQSAPSPAVDVGGSSDGFIDPVTGEKHTRPGGS